MKTENIQLLISVILLLGMIATFIIIDFPSRNDTNEMKDLIKAEVSNLSETFSNETESLREEIRILKEQNEEDLSQIITNTQYLIPKKDELSLSFLYAGNKSLSQIDEDCNLSLFECLKVKEVEESRFLNKTYSLVQIAIENKENVAQKNIHLSLDCSRDTILFMGISRQYPKVKEYHSNFGIQWDIIFDELPPKMNADWIIVSFPYIIDNEGKSCSIAVYSDTSKTYYQDYKIYSNKIESISSYMIP